MFDNFGEALKYYREKRKISQKELAYLTGSGQVQVNRHEKNKVNPEHETVQKYIEVLSLSPQESEILFSLAGYNQPSFVIHMKDGKVNGKYFSKVSFSEENPSIEEIIKKTAQETAEKTNKRIDLLTEMLKKVYEDDLKEEFESIPPIEGIIKVHHTDKTRKYPLLSNKSACGFSLIPAEDEIEDFIDIPERYNIPAEFILQAKGDCLENERIFDGYLVFVKRQDTASSGDIVAVRVIENNHGHAILKKLRIIKGHIFLTDKSDEIIEFTENMSIIGKAIYWMPDPRKFG